jgi:hypothetical protein
MSDGRTGAVSEDAMAKPEQATSRIPVFNSYQEAAEFWDTHSTTEFEDEWEPVEVAFPLEVSSEFFVEITFDKATWRRLRDFARQRGVRVSALAKEWVLEGFERALAEADAATTTPAGTSGDG